MEKEFVPYTLALEMKSIGFDEPCLAIHSNANPKTGLYTLKKYRLKLIKQASQKDKGVKAPLYQQAFRFFRENHGLIYSIGHIGHTNTWAYEIINMRIAGPDYGYGETYEEAELACLVKLIEIVKK